jgi:hypothetical protein
MMMMPVRTWTGLLWFIGDSWWAVARKAMNIRVS